MIEANLITTKPGIYCFKNCVNGKCYIGQAVNLQKRFKAHMKNFKNKRYDTPLYRAFDKYTLDQFEYSILETIEEETENLKLLLDNLEKQYIQQHNSYKEGYNQTLGGDYGILGYKFTPEQVAKQRENTLKVVEDGRYEVVVFDISINKYYTFLNMRIAADTMGFKESSFRSAKCHKRCYLERYYIASSIEEIKEIVNNKSKKKCKKYSKEDAKNLYKEYWEYLSKFDKISIKQIESDLGLSKSTIMKRNQKLRQMGYELKMIGK